MACVAFLILKCAEIPIIQCVLNFSISFDDFHILQNTGYNQKHFVATLNLTKLVFYNLSFLKDHNSDDVQNIRLKTREK